MDEVYCTYPQNLSLASLSATPYTLLFPIEANEMHCQILRQLVHSLSLGVN